MPTPVVNIISVSKSKISNIVDMNKSTIIFTFNIPIQAYIVRIGGNSHDIGLDSSSKSLYVQDLANRLISDVKNITVKEIRQIDSDVNITEEINSMELSEGINRVNIYGQSLDGQWNLYE